MKSKKMSELRRLVDEVQQCAPESPQWEDKVADVAHSIFPGCRFNYASKGMPSSEVYQEIDAQIEAQLWLQISLDLKGEKLEIQLEKWIDDLRKRVFKKVLDDAQLHNLAKIASQTEPGSQQQRITLGRLLQALHFSGKKESLKHSLRNDWRDLSISDFESLYEYAFFEVWEYVCKAINRYDFDTKQFSKSLQWLLKRRFISCYKKIAPQLNNEHEFPNGDPGNFESPYKSHSEKLYESLHEFVTQDPRFESIHMQGYPRVTLRLVTLEYLAGKKWHEIAAKFEVRSLQAVRQFFYKKVQQFRDDFECFRNLLND